MTKQSIPLLDLNLQYDAIREDIEAAIERVFASQQFIMGEEVSGLEKEIAAYHGVNHAIGVASGTDALTLGLRALGIGPGDEVIMPAFTFFATAECILHVGATPVFVDVMEDSYCIDPLQVAPLVNHNTRAILPVHLFGHPADMDALTASTGGRVKIVEDNAQAFGAAIDDRILGAIGDIGCFSFFPSKNLGCYGDGGMVLTESDEVAERLRMLRMHGWRKKNFPEIVGYNSRLDSLQAAMLRVKLPHVDEWNRQRREAAAIYSELLEDLPLTLPGERDRVYHVYNLYVIGVDDRDQVQGALNTHGIANAVYYPAPIHRLRPCREYVKPGQEFPVAERAAQRLLAIPMYPGIARSQQEVVAEVLRRVLG